MKIWGIFCTIVATKAAFCANCPKNIFCTRSTDCAARRKAERMNNWTFFELVKAKWALYEDKQMDAGDWGERERRKSESREQQVRKKTNGYWAFCIQLFTVFEFLSPILFFLILDSPFCNLLLHRSVDFAVLSHTHLIFILFIYTLYFRCLHCLMFLYIVTVSAP